MAHDVFISYSTKDKSTADAVCATLEGNGIRCWIAPRDVLPGVSWPAAIIQGINGSRVMVLVFSSNANTSPQIEREVAHAINKAVAILPLRIENVTPSGSMEYYLATPHWMDALTPPLSKHLQDLAETVKLLLTRLGKSQSERATIRIFTLGPHGKFGFLLWTADRKKAKECWDAFWSQRMPHEEERARMVAEDYLKLYTAEVRPKAVEESDNRHYRD